MDISLVPMEDLIKEISNRTEVFVIGYTRRIDAGDPCVIISHYGNWLKSIGICDIIKEDLIDLNYRTKDKS